jgi:HAD superfamily hydrolase (TIGR01509 family)
MDSGGLQLVIFDCDGVLVDSERLSNAIMRDMVEELGYRASFEDIHQQFVGLAMPACIARIEALTGASAPSDFSERFWARMFAAFETQLTAVPGIEAVLDSLTVPYCVASNGRRVKIEFTLGHTGLLSRFAGRIFSVEDVRHPKPAPDLFLHAARTLGADASRTTVVEDTPTGVNAARAAGMRVIGYAAMTPAQRLVQAGADAIAGTMDEVRQLLTGT